MDYQERQRENRRRLEKAIKETGYRITHEIIDGPVDDSKEDPVSELKVRFHIRETSSPNVVLGTLVESVAIDSLGSHLPDVLAEARAQAFVRFALIASQLQDSFPNSVKPLVIALDEGFFKR